MNEAAPSSPANEKVAPLRVLAVIADPDVGHAVEHVVREEGDAADVVGSIDEAVSRAKERPIDVAFVELRADGGAALALCHHLPTLCPRVTVVAIVAPQELERGTEALSLGAASVIVAPPTGDALARVLNDVKRESVRGAHVTALEEKLARERKRLETYDRLVRFARGAAQSDAVRAIVEGVSQISGARGVALYATFGDKESERVRLAAIGSALDFPATSAPADLSRMVQARHARVVPLVTGSGELGILVLDQAPPASEAEISNVADLAAAMLSLVDRHDHVDESVRVFPARHFRTVADRMLTLAARHDRRASMLAVTLPSAERPGRREEATLEIADIVRNTDALCGTEDGDLLVFLPETTGLGAHACRRRILARLSGDRRSRPKGGAGSGRSQEPAASKPARRAAGATSPIAVGVATFPHDGNTLKKLVRAARSRAVDDGRSPVHALALDAMPLHEVVDALIARPMFDAGPRSPYPLDVACSSLFALVARACREATRGGEASILTTLQPGLGVAAAARQSAAPRVLDVRAEPGCENVEAIVVEAEHGAWVCCGRVIGDRFRGVHAADPLLADVLTRRLSAAGGAHAG
ncbi:MAG: response regulator [Labilithrix sp.]|nr:response regulator [Labilithrix sp.]